MVSCSCRFTMQPDFLNLRFQICKEALNFRFDFARQGFIEVNSLLEIGEVRRQSIIETNEITPFPSGAHHLCMHLQHVLALWLASFQSFKMGPCVGAFDFR